MPSIWRSISSVLAKEILQSCTEPLVSPLHWPIKKLQYLQCVSNGDTAVLHWTIDISLALTHQISVSFQSGRGHRDWAVSPGPHSSTTVSGTQPSSSVQFPSCHSARTVQQYNAHGPGWQPAHHYTLPWFTMRCTRGTTRKLPTKNSQQ